MTELLDWRAAGYFRIGEAAQAAGEYERARDAYGAALELAPEHEATRFNLAVTLIRCLDPWQALERLNALERDLRSGPGAVALLRSVAYNRALAYAYGGDERIAMHTARDLVADLFDAKPADEAEQDFIARMEGPATSLLASLIPPGDEPVAERGGPAPAREQFEQTLSGERSLSAKDSRRFERYARAHHGDEPRTAYNLACLDVRDGRFDAAREDLTLAFAERTLRPWAERDPFLAPLRERAGLPTPSPEPPVRGPWWDVRSVFRARRPPPP